MKEQTHITLPALGEEIEKATVACWHVHEGEIVREDDDVLEVVTDKATFNIPAEKPGVIREILVPEGQDAEIGAPLAVIELLGEQDVEKT